MDALPGGPQIGGIDAVLGEQAGDMPAMFGGYARHKTALARGGGAALAEELARDTSRLWSRNLARDDRVVSAHGKELRAPFLDEDVVACAMWVASHAPSALVSASPSGSHQSESDSDERERERDKLPVRGLLSAEFGMSGSAARAKRAAQFGSRVAKAVWAPDVRDAQAPWDLAKLLIPTQQSETKFF